MKKRYLIAAIIVGISFALAALLTVLILDFGGDGDGAGDGRPKLIYSSGSAQKEYDGQPLTAQSATLTQGTLGENLTAQIEFSGAQTNAGSSANLFSVKLFDGTRNVSDDYNIELNFGRLTVTARKISILSKNRQKIYDATELKGENVSLESGELVENHSIEVEFLGGRKTVGTSQSLFEAKVLDAEQNDQTANYEIEKMYGQLQVLPRPLKVFTATDYKIYDGTPLTNHNYNLSSGLLDIHRLELEFFGSQTEADNSKNSAVATILEQDEIVTDNYALEVVEGDLFVFKRGISLRSGSAAKLYNGEPLTSDQWDFISSQKTLPQHQIKVIISGTQTEIGKSPNYFGSIDIFEGERNVNHNYSVETQNGELVVRDTPPIVPQPTGNELDLSGDLNADSFSKRLAARVLSPISDSIYLKLKSFGNFRGNGWLDAPISPFKMGEYSYNYLSGFALLESGMASHPITISSLTNDYLLPYYLEPAYYNYEIQGDDTQNIGYTGEEYSAYYYNYFGAGFAYYDNVDSAYYSHLAQNYLSIDADTRMFFEEIIYKSGLRFSANILQDATELIKNSAVYNLDFDRNLDLETNIVTAFLSAYNEGICVHFASALTLLLRALNIPARYVIGYSGQTKADAWSDINTPHAWVEAYVKGFGWVMLEPTPPQINDNPTPQGSLQIKPRDIVQKFERGITLLPTNQIDGLSDLIASGYTYTAQISGSLNSIGIAYTYITEFKLFDSIRRDVTDNFAISFLRGKLHMYAFEITISTASISKVYDGKRLNENSYKLDGELLSGHKIVADFVGEQTDAGKSQNRCNIQIVDSFGADLTFMYKVNRLFGTLTVSPRTLTVEAGSAKREYDGTPLTYDHYEYSGQLNEGDNLVVELSGEQTDRGRSQNKILSVCVVNFGGKDVSANYIIVAKNGWLTIT